jgi:tRNA-Thr(GGU) m(6)t(6)A37 methyltransferase TsaA
MRIVLFVMPEFFYPASSPFLVVMPEKMDSGSTHCRNDDPFKIGDCGPIVLFVMPEFFYPASSPSLVVMPGKMDSGSTHCRNDDPLHANMKIEYQPIGIIHTPYTDLAGMPIQPLGAVGVEGRVEVFAEYREGLQDLDGFSHVILLYHLHGSKGFKLRVMPFLDTEQRGLFATRAPKRPNPIGLSVVRLRKVEEGVLLVENVDMLDGTPLLDIKPYIPAFDAQSRVRTGWFAKAIGMAAHKKADDRFR